MIRQFAFDLGAAETYRAADFFTSDANATAYVQVMGGNWPDRRLLLIGPSGAGKSHLAHIWAETANARILASSDLSSVNLAAVVGAVVVEDAQNLAGKPAAEEALFHLWNRAGGDLLITAQDPPRDWGLRLPDLLSRMQSIAIAGLNPPDDALLAAVLVKLFADRQVHVQPNLIAYLVARMERSVAAARGVVAALDARALALGRPITRGMAADLLGDDSQATGRDLDSGGPG